LTPLIASPRGRRVAGALATALAALALTACGSDPTAPGDAETGKGLFVSGCGTCHVLADAGTEGVTGPNLDDAFRQARADGWEKSQIQAVTREWMELAELPMPRDIYTGQEANDVAAYVAEAAGTSAESAVRKPRPLSPPKSLDPTSVDDNAQAGEHGAEGEGEPSTTEPREPSEEKGQPEGSDGE
jgi:mono/diheme cytochrome c family protein